jgi:hypothetical protein
MDEATLIGIGTDSASGGVFEGNTKNIVETMKDMVTQTE